MEQCNHQYLMLLPKAKGRVRCLHCHLTLLADELGEGYCPECFETKGMKRFDFETVDTPGEGKTRYRCEECNIIIEYG